MVKKGGFLLVESLCALQVTGINNCFILCDSNYEFYKCKQSWRKYVFLSWASASPLLLPKKNCVFKRQLLDFFQVHIRSAIFFYNTFFLNCFLYALYIYIYIYLVKCSLYIYTCTYCYKNNKNTCTYTYFLL